MNYIAFLTHLCGSQPRVEQRPSEEESPRGNGDVGEDVAVEGEGELEGEGLGGK